MKVSSTIGFERRHNELLGEEDEDRFVERATRAPPQPPNFQAVVDIAAPDARGGRRASSPRASSS